MSSTPPLDRSRPIPRQIVNILIGRIRAGEDGYQPGDKAPGLVAISTEWDVSTSTAQKVLSTLRDAGWVRTELGIGTFVADELPKDD